MSHGGTLLSWDGSLIRGKLSHIQHSEHPTMVSIRRIVTQWGRRIVGGLIVTLLFSQMALAMYACPKLDADTHAASMQMAGMAMDEAAGMSAMPDCHAMPGTMDDESPQLCRAHCSGDGTVSARTGRSIYCGGPCGLDCLPASRGARPAIIDRRQV